MPNHEPENTERQFFDVLGHPELLNDPNTGETSGAPAFLGAPAIPANKKGAYFNIDDPSFQVTEGQWGTEPLIMGLSPLVTEPKTCQDECDEQAALRRKNCALLRKRVAIALKKAGCPSKIIPIKEPKRCGARKVTATAAVCTSGVCALTS